MKLLLVGLDALDIKFFESSNLPAFKQLRNRAQWGTLHAAELWSGPNWTTIFTGLTKEHHGVTDSLGRPFDSEWIGSRPRDYLWDVLAENGYTVGVMNFPACYVARTIGPGSWMVGGWPGRPNVAPNQKLPGAFYSDVPDYSERGTLAALRPKGAGPGWAIHEWPFKDYMEWAYKNYDLEIHIAHQMQATDVLMIQCSVLDRAGHMLSTGHKGHQGANDKRYKAALNLAHWFLADAIDIWPSDYVALVSDHGFQGTKHSYNGTWAIAGPDVAPIRNNIEQADFMPTVLAALGIECERDGASKLIRKDTGAFDAQMKGLGYVV